MPGAFTTTCSTEHLPGYVQSAKKLQSLGIDTIAVVTTNDRFVNQEWSAQQGLITTADSTGSSPTITMLCDADGDFVKSIGLAEDMGFGVGVRSKRFTMITENGVVKTLLTDDGMDDCSSTSAANVVKLLSPDPAPGSSDSAVEIDGKLILGAAGVGLLAILTVFMGGNDGASTSSVPKSSNAQQNRILPQKSSSDTNFSLLNEYIKK
jgi:glutaredoxin/glutathione-dependent peroxiredoxin